MGFYVLVQPEENASAMLVEHVQGHPSLIVQCGDSQIAVQVPGRRDGVQWAISFGRALSDAASDFADRCEALTRLAPPDMSQWQAAVGKEVDDRPESD